MERYGGIKQGTQPRLGQIKDFLEEISKLRPRAWQAVPC